MPLYAMTTSAHRQEGYEMITHLILADNNDHAYGIGYRLAHEEFPRSKGWEQQQVGIARASAEILQTALAEAS